MKPIDSVILSAELVKELTETMGKEKATDFLFETFTSSDGRKKLQKKKDVESAYCFIDSITPISGCGITIKRGELYADYANWAELKFIKYVGKKIFFTELRKIKNLKEIRLENYWGFIIMPKDDEAF